MFESARQSRKSHSWKALYDRMKWLQEGMQWIVRDGQNIRVWADNWMLGGTLRSSIKGLLMLNEENWQVSSLRHIHTWNLDSHQVLLPPHIAHLIKGITVAQLT